MEDRLVKSRLTRWIADYFAKKANQEITTVVRLAFQAKPVGVELMFLIGLVSVGGVFFGSEGIAWLALTLFCVLAMLFSIAKMAAKGIAEYRARLSSIKRGEVALKEAQKIVKAIPRLQDDDLWLLTRIINLAYSGLTDSPLFRAEVQEASNSPKLRRLSRLFGEIVDASVSK